MSKLIPQLPTYGRTSLCAALRQPLPSQDFCGTAALPLKPDIARRGWHGRKVPEGDILSPSAPTRPYDTLVVPEMHVESSSDAMNRDATTTDLMVLHPRRAT